MSLVKKLYHSRNKTTAVSELVTLIENKASNKGLNVSRWQANRGNFDCTVTWAVHGGERPNMSRDLPDSALVESFIGIEGKTKQCRAYGALYALLRSF